MFICGSYLHNKLGIDGLKTDTVTKFTLCTHMADRSVKKVACGDYHTMCLLTDGSVHSWGGSLHKKLGANSDPIHTAFHSKDPNSPHLVEELYGKHIIDIDCGDFHSIALDGNGNVYTWGGGGKTYNKGQCGHGDYDDVNQPRQIAAFVGKKVSKISAGGFHSVALTTQNELYVWGAGVYGDINNTASPRLVQLPN